MCSHISRLEVFLETSYPCITLKYYSELILSHVHPIYDLSLHLYNVKNKLLFEIFKLNWSMHQYHMLICYCKCVNVLPTPNYCSTNYNSFSKTNSFVCFWLILKIIKSKSVSTQRHLFQNKTLILNFQAKKWNISHNILKAMHLKKTSWTGCSNNIQRTIRLVKKTFSILPAT